MAVLPTLFAILLVGWVAVFAIYAPELPDTDRLLAGNDKPRVRVLAADGTILAQDAGGGFVPLHAVSPSLVEAVIATEDQHFWYHFGLDPVGIARAAWVNFQAGGLVQGGSTITQQLAKVLFLTPDRSLKRKLEEMTLAVWLEARLTKEEILTLYLNRVYLGAGAYGVEAAARRYFGKSAGALDLAEAAMIAGLLKAPSALAPTNDLDGARSRAAVVLRRMVAEGYVTAAEAVAARAKPARLTPEIEGDLAGYFVDWVLDGVEEALGPPQDDLVIRTTLDTRLQRHAQGELQGLVTAQGPKVRLSDGAVVLLDRNGAVVAMVGGRSYRTSRLNRAVETKRQPGSAFKPFLFLAALEQGYTPDSRLLDRPIKVGDWAPGNFDGKFRGEVTLEQALALSLNTPAVRLVQDVGVTDVVDVAHRLGIASVIRSVPSVALGTSEVSLLELTGAYLPFATGGVAHPLHAVSRITTAGDGRVIYSHAPAATRVIPAADATLMRQMLTAAVRSGSGRAAAIEGRPVAGKTGTTQNNRDAWFVGWSGDYVLGVWLGNDDGAPMRNVTGGGLPARLWRTIMVATPKPAAEPPPAPVAARPARRDDGTGLPQSARNIPEELAGRAASWLMRLVDDALSTARQ